MFGKCRSTITIKSIESHISQLDIAARYLSITKIPCLINSPFRKDTHPSFCIYTKDGKKVLWIDYSTNENGDIYNLLQNMWHCKLSEVINRIYKDFSKNNKISKLEVDSNSPTIYKKDDSILQCKVRSWQSYDIEYWGTYGITLDWLKYADVYPISHKIIIRNNKKYVFCADKLAYAFIEHKENNITIKIYQPFNKKGYKWCNKHDRSVISLWTKIPEKGNKLVICSSLKDALCLWENSNIPCVAVQGEGYNISDTVIKELNERFKNVYILFDNDKPGLEDGVKLQKLTNFKNLVLPHFDGGKDISDMYKVMGKNKFKNIINKLFI